jgi:N-acetylmuramoyl-L-alanine amidase
MLNKHSFAGILAFGILFMLPPTLAAQLNLEITIDKGDLVNLIINKYKLNKYHCNTKEFLALNNLKSNTPLKIAQKLKLPIAVYANQKLETILTKKQHHLIPDIKNYNKQMTLAKLKPMSITWVPFGILNCPPTLPVNQEDLVPEANASTLKLLKQTSVAVKSKKLKGAVFYLISGHGGPDPGAMATVGKATVSEDEYAYDVTLRLARELMAHCASVYMIIKDANDGIRNTEILKMDKDEVCTMAGAIPLNQKERLCQRSEVVNKLFEENSKKKIKYQRVIEIHIDSRSTNTSIDLFFYHKEFSRLGQRLANTMHSVFKNKYAIHRKTGEYHGVVETRDLHMLREMKLPSVFIELGNINNSFDRKRILQPNNRQLLAEWMTEGILHDY